MIFADLDQKYPSQTHKLDRFRKEFEKVRHLDGDLAEFGVYNGNGSRELAQLDPSRLVWAFDTYAGMPAADYGGDADSSDVPGKWIPTGTPEELFAGIPNIRPVKGRFAETLPGFSQDVRFVLCHIDCDWYKSHKEALGFLETRLQPGAILLFDDPGLPGSRRAIAEWVVKWQLPYSGGDKITWHA